jgi:hypothetical protein
VTNPTSEQKITEPKDICQKLNTQPQQFHEY